jgi:hypothetical protein
LPAADAPSNFSPSATRSAWILVSGEMALKRGAQLGARCSLGHFRQDIDELLFGVQKVRELVDEVRTQRSDSRHVDRFCKNGTI